MLTHASVKIKNSVTKFVLKWTISEFVYQLFTVLDFGVKNTLIVRIFLSACSVINCKYKLLFQICFLSGSVVKMLIGLSFCEIDHKTEFEE